MDRNLDSLRPNTSALVVLRPPSGQDLEAFLESISEANWWRSVFFGGDLRKDINNPINTNTELAQAFDVRWNTRIILSYVFELRNKIGNGHVVANWNGNDLPKDILLLTPDFYPTSLIGSNSPPAYFFDTNILDCVFDSLLTCYA